MTFRGAGGIALFYTTRRLAFDGMLHWDKQEEQRLAIKQLPRYEVKRTRKNVFLNFDLVVSGALIVVAAPPAQSLRNT